jgi:hypothetical protein
MIFDDEQVATQLSEAWEHDSGKDELNVVLQGLEQHFWRGTEAGWLGCYDFGGETWAGDGCPQTKQQRDRSTNVQWVQAASAFRDLGIVSRLGWAEKRRGSAR